MIHWIRSNYHNQRDDLGASQRLSCNLLTLLAKHTKFSFNHMTRHFFFCLNSVKTNKQTNEKKPNTAAAHPAAGRNTGRPPAVYATRNLPQGVRWGNVSAAYYLLILFTLWKWALECESTVVSGRGLSFTHRSAAADVTQQNARLGFAFITWKWGRHAGDVLHLSVS